MNLPSSTLRFAGMMVAEPRPIDLHVLQAHVIKHVFGMEALMSGHRRRAERVWNREGWDRLDPPALTVEQRRGLVERIGKLELAGASCQVPRLEAESYGGEPPEDWLACYRCPRNLASVCAAVTREVATAYGRVVDDTLMMVADPAGETVGRADVMKRAMKQRNNLTGLAVLTVGFSSGDTPAGIVRVNCWDGVRVELWRDSEDRLRWRTAYRIVPATPVAQLNHLLDDAFVVTNQTHPLSAQCIVPRLWWQSTEGGRS